MSKYPKEGRRVKTLPPMSYVMPYIMKTRNTSMNYIKDVIDIEKAEAYIRRKRQDQFYTQYIEALINEAVKLQMSKEEIITLVEKGYENECNSN